jgi:putative transposase
MYSEGKLTDAKVLNEVKKVLTNHVKKKHEFGWMNHLSSRVYQNALDLKDAFSRYRSGKAGHPKFASRRDGQSFTVDSSNGKVLLNAGSTIKIPTLGTFRLYKPLECGFVSQIFTISKKGSRWESFLLS